MPASLPSMDDYTSLLAILTNIQTQLTANVAKLDDLLARVAKLEQRPSTSPSASTSHSASPSGSTSHSTSPSGSTSRSTSPSASVSPSPAPVPPAPANTTANTAATPIVVPPGDHSYFNALVSHPALQAQYSLRTQAQINRWSSNGRGKEDRVNPWVVYDSKVDAAKVIVPPFTVTGFKLLQPLSATDTVVTLDTAGGTQVINSSLRINGEWIRLLKGYGDVSVKQTRPDGTTFFVFPVERGQFGTPIAAHPITSVVEQVTNSLPDQVWMPFTTEVGASYLVTWDAMMSPDIWSRPRFEGGKTFQIRQNDKIYFEVQTNTYGFTKTRPESTETLRVTPPLYGTHTIRAYCPVPTGMINEPIRPHTVAEINVGEWIRYWVHLRRTADANYFSFYVCGAKRTVVSHFTDVALAPYPVNSFQLEFNSSQDRHVALRGNQEVWVRNVAILKNPTNVPSLLVPVR